MLFTKGWEKKSNGASGTGLYGRAIVRSGSKPY
jgi:hypothetical protein